MLEAGQAVANQPVKLHRVTQDGQGFTIDSTVTDTNGRFELSVDRLDKPGVLFAATQYQGKLYIGNTFRETPTSEYLLMVGRGATPIEFENADDPSASQQSVSQPDNPGAGLAVIIVAVFVLTTIFALALRQRVPPERRLLVEIADLDNRNANTPMPRYEEQRAELVRRLRETA